MLPGYRRLMREGTRAIAVIVASEEVRVALAGRRWFRLRLRVPYPDGTTAETSRVEMAYLLDGRTGVGMEVPVRYAPNMPSDIEVDLAAIAAENERYSRELDAGRLRRTQGRHPPG